MFDPHIHSITVIIKILLPQGDLFEFFDSLKSEEFFTWECNKYKNICIQGNTEFQ